MESGTAFSLILASLRGNFPPACGWQYGKLKPLKGNPTLHSEIIQDMRTIRIGVIYRADISLFLLDPQMQG
jgi:hypothetical protein